MIKMKKLIKLSALALVLIMMVAAFASCAAPAKDPKDAKKALEDADYEVMLIDDETTLKYMGVDGLTAYLYAFNEDEEGIYIYYFEDKDAANDAWEDIEKEVEELKEAAEEEDVELIVKKSGSMIWYGTKAAIKAAK